MRFRRLLALSRTALLASLSSVAILLSWTSSATAQAPLHEQVDALIEARMGGAASEPASDGEFLRRATLDLAGRIPTIEETRQFLADASPDKRAKRIEALLAAPEYADRMADFLHVMLMERQGDAVEWRKYLHHSATANKPWDQMVREMIWSDPNQEASQGAAFFFTKRLENYGQNPVDIPGMVRDVGRLFLGMDVQCAQCHDHLFVKDYTQDYYQGLFAFVGQAQIRRDVKTPALAETPLKKKVEFTSVFVQEPRTIGPKLPGGVELDVPEWKAGEEYLTPPDKKTNFPGELKFSPLKLLAEKLPRRENPAFARNMANRLWWMLMGRGLVHPLDLHHSENPPSHPELLELLANEFAAHQFDMKWLIGQLALTRTYQRSSRLPEGASPESVPETSYRTALEKPLSAEQILASMRIATGQAQAEAAAKPNDKAQQEELAKLRERFAKAFANPPKEPETEFAPSVKAALFLMNDAVVLGWLQPRDGNLTARLAAIPDAQQTLEELFLSVLSRPPAEDERQELLELLQRPDSQGAEQRAAMLGRLAWALLASTEFAINH
ncbi:MAG: DUF1549 domain-containing protein [Pirellulales bacterium]